MSTCLFARSDYLLEPVRDQPVERLNSSVTGRIGTSRRPSLDGEGTSYRITPICGINSAVECQLPNRYQLTYHLSDGTTGTGAGEIMIAPSLLR